MARSKAIGWSETGRHNWMAYVPPYPDLSVGRPVSVEAFFSTTARIDSTEDLLSARDSTFAPATERWRRQDKEVRVSSSFGRLSTDVYHSNTRLSRGASTPPRQSPSCL
jgi:hypothetical protein